MDIRITVNQKPLEAKEGMTVVTLLEFLNYSKRVAVWINGQQLLLADYPTRVVLEGDQIKIRRIVAGG